MSELQSLYGLSGTELINNFLQIPPERGASSKSAAQSVPSGNKGMRMPKDKKEGHVAMQETKRSHQTRALFSERSHEPTRTFMKKLQVEPGEDHVFNLDNDEVAALEHFDQKGFVVIHLNMDQEQQSRRAERFITNVWNETMQDSFWREEPVMITDPSILKAMKYDKGSEALMKKINAVMRKQFKNQWFFQHGEGAPASCRAFHNNIAWVFRQDDIAFELATALLGTNNLYYNIDRAIITPPGAGYDKMPHSRRARDSNDGEFSLEGEYYAVDAEFVGIPGSHKHFIKYRRDHLNGNLALENSTVEFCLDVEKDPTNLSKECKVYKVPAGCTVFWHSDLLRATRKNRKKSIVFGQKLGYSKVETRKAPGEEKRAPPPEAHRRYQVWKTGSSPEFYPSGDKVHLFPEVFRDRPSDWAEICDRISQHKSDKKLNIYETPLLKPGHNGEMKALQVDEVARKNHVPMFLNDLGRALLVGEEHVNDFLWNTVDNMEKFDVIVDEA